MKLYTEEQVIQMIEKSRETGLTGEYLILNNKGIELPSDEEIEMISIETYRDYPHTPKEHPDWLYGKDINAPRKRKAFIKGAKWMRYKIGGKL